MKSKIVNILSQGILLYIKFCFTICFLILIGRGDLFGETKTASLSGNWSNTATWGDSPIPLPTDNVIINAGVSVTLDIDALCASLTPGLSSGTATLGGNHILTTGTISITSNLNNNVTLSVLGETTIICTSILVVSIDGTKGNFILSGILKNSGSTSSLLNLICNTGSTVEYNGASQSVHNTYYSNLKISGSGAKCLQASTNILGTLIITENATLCTNNYPLKLGGDYIGPNLNAGSSSIIFNGNTNQNISSFTTSGSVSVNKTQGTVLFKGNVIGGPLTINGNLDLGTGLTHTFKDNFTFSNGILYGGSSIIKIGGNYVGQPNVSFIAGTSTLEYNGTSQNIAPFIYNILIVSGNGTKTALDNIIVNGNLEIDFGSNLLTKNITVYGMTSISGTFTINDTGTKNFIGNVIINNGGFWDETNMASINFGGNLQNDCLKFTANSGIYNFNGNNKSISGSKTLSIPTVIITGNYTNNITTSFSSLTVNDQLFNNGTINVKNSLSGVGQLTQCSTGILNIGGTSTITTLTASLPNNTVTYNKTGDQTINACSFYNLITSGSGIKTIAPDSEITVNGNLTTNGLLSINSNETNSGSLIVKGTSIGSVKYNRWYNHSGIDYSRWYIASSPVKANGFNLNNSKIHQDINTNPVLYDFATYSEEENDWAYVTAIPDILTPAEGYLISMKPSSDGIIQYSGEINNEIVQKLVSANNDNGWNAVGNPYTSAIKITGPGGFLETNVNNGRILSPDFAAIYVWNEDGSYNGNQQYYKAIGNSGYFNLTNYDGSPIDGPNIQTGQGFLIKANTSGNLLFNRSMQVHQTDLSLKTVKLSWPGVTLLVKSKDQRRSTVVAFHEGMTTGLDVTYDAGLLSFDNFKLYTRLVDGSNLVNFTIQCLPEDQYSNLSVPVGIEFPEGGDIEFKASGIILPPGIYPILEDRELHLKTILMTETDKYVVKLPKNTSNNGRFYLSFGDKTVGNNDIMQQNRFSIRLVKNCLTIDGIIDQGTKAFLYDFSGRLIGEYLLNNLNHNEIFISELNQRFYILKVKGQKVSETFKLNY